MSLDIGKKELILEKAKDMIIVDGYSNLSISKLTSELEISKGSFYTYFQSKDEMLGEILDEYKKNIAEFAENLSKKSKNIDEYIDNYIDTIINLNDYDLKLELTIVNLRSNYEILNEENFKKVKEIAKSLISSIEDTLKKYLEEIDLDKKDIFRCAKMLFAIAEVFTTMESLDFTRGKFSVKSLEEVKKNTKSGEMKENLDFIKRIIKKILN